MLKSQTRATHCGLVLSACSCRAFPGPLLWSRRREVRRAGLRKPWTAGLFGQDRGPRVSLREVVGVVGGFSRGRVRVASAFVWCLGFLPQGAPRPFKPLFALSKHVVGGAFAVLFAPAFASEHQHRKGQQICRGPGIVAGGDSWGSCHQISGPGFPGRFWDVGSQREAGGEAFVEVWCIRVEGGVLSHFGWHLG